MEIRIRETGQVMFESEFRSYLLANDGPTYETLTQEVADLLGVDVVFEGPQAQPTRYQTAYRDGVEQIGDKWFTKYSVADMDDEAKANVNANQAKSVRDTRNQLLKDCDWTQLSDSTADKAAWATYRQALRDIPSQNGFPYEIEWPKEP